MSTRGRQSLPLRLSGWFGDPQIRVALVAAAAMLIEAVLAKNVFEVHLDFISQFVGMWVFIAFQASGQRDRVAELAWSAAVVAATAGVLLVYAL
jgi:hypothetical protein